MSLKNKYEEVLELGKKFNVQNGDVKEESNLLKVKGTAKTQYQKDRMWDKIKQIGGENPSDIQADIKVADNSAYHYHEVESGETLSKIAKKYYGESSEYMKIFKANDDKLKDPDMIHPGQVLTIPFPS